MIFMKKNNIRISKGALLLLALMMVCVAGMSKSSKKKKTNNAQRAKMVMMARSMVNKPVTDGSNTLNGHEYVDLGLSVKWATCNVGATSPEKSGDFYAWGEKQPHANGKYDWDNYSLCNGTYTKLSKYVTDSKLGKVDNRQQLEATDDVATAKWGEGWRMPTLKEIEELEQNTETMWVDNYRGTGVSGRLVRSKMKGYEDKSIFLPASGFIFGTSLSSKGEYAIFWSSTLSPDKDVNAMGLKMSRESFDSHADYNRVYGACVRPVTK